MNLKNIPKTCDIASKFIKSLHKYKDSQVQSRRYVRRFRGSNRYGAAEDAKFKSLLKNLYESQAPETDTATESKLSSMKKHAVKGSMQTETDTFKRDIEIPTVEMQYDFLANIMTPLHNLPYEIQLRRKFKDNITFLKTFGKQLKEKGIHIVAESDNQPCVLDPTVPSPIISAYRNNDEFSIRNGVDGMPKVVGFFLNSPSGTSQTICVGPKELPIIKDSHKEVAQFFEKYIRKSALPACHNLDDGGHWRNIIVRSNQKGDLMAIVVMHPQNLSQEELQTEMGKLKRSFINSNLNLKSLYFQACHQTRCSHNEAPFQLLFGDPRIEEEINNLKFRISPESFFQTNTLAAEKLYKLIFKACKPEKNTTLLDICCGIGPISLTFAHHVKNCIGIDTSEQAIEDAKLNAEMNGITNVEFHCGKSEKMLIKILDDIYTENLIAVINPSRNGLGLSAIRLLRNCSHLKKIVYVSSNPEAALPNFMNLVVPSGKRVRGTQFWPMRAVPVDLFPQTNHCELVVLFQRK